MVLDLAELLAPGGPVAQRLEGFEPRPQQLEMATAVESAMAARTSLIVEAGTGVGKSFAYLLPAIRRIVGRRERVVVATNTITLQEQIVEKDIPLLRAVIPEPFSAVLVKGRNNYLSLRRLKLASERQDRLFGEGDAERTALHAVEDWAYTTRDGSLATLPVLKAPAVWDLVQSDTHNCMGRACPTYDRCFYQTARRRMEDGDLLVCNHALFFADLALRGEGAGFLPPYDHVILDEAHGVEDVAAEHFGVSLGEGRVWHLLSLLHHERTGRGFLGAFREKDGASGLCERVIDQVARCREEAQAFFDALARWRSESGPENGRITRAGIVPCSLSDAMKDLAALLMLLREKAPTRADEFELNSYSRRAAGIAADVRTLIGQELEGRVYWVEGGEARGGTTMREGHGRVGSRTRRRLSLNCVQIEVGEILAERLFAQKISVTLTSATLASGPGDFTHVAERLGCRSARTLQLGSPFDHAAQMTLHVDPSMCDPRDGRYVQELWPRILEHVRATGGGAFVLFTSFDTLERVAELLLPHLAAEAYPVLVHGRDGPPGLLVKRFREDERSVLLGTASFWQGVDVRGRGLRNVIITRLPFDVPGRPLIEARHERIEARGGSPFAEDALPRAVIRFKQGVGRLIRSTTDTGRVVVLDPRLVRKPYGRLFLSALPEGVAAEGVS